MDDLDDHRDFLAALPEPRIPSPPGPKAQTLPEIDAGAAHIAASFTELKISVQRLHTDLAQRMRTMEAKLDALETRVGAASPNWRALSAEVLKASERGGQGAAEKALVVNEVLAKEVQHVADVRSHDIRVFRNFVYWIILPGFLIGLALLVKAGRDAERLPPIWFLPPVFLLGIGGAVIGLKIRNKYRYWLPDRLMRQRPR